MTEAEFKTFKHHVEYELKCTCDQQRLRKLYNKIEFAENVEEIQVIVLDIFREIQGMKKLLKEYFDYQHVAFLEPKEDK